MKYCPKCKQEKPNQHFSHDKQGKPVSWCKACMNKKSWEYTQNSNYRTIYYQWRESLGHYPMFDTEPNPFWKPQGGKK
jgi:hypothetical protein